MWALPSPALPVAVDSLRGAASGGRRFHRPRMAVDRGVATFAAVFYATVMIYQRLFQPAVHHPQPRDCAIEHG